jgi:outer membrane lipoprotein carrier protein
MPSLQNAESAWSGCSAMARRRHITVPVSMHRKPVTGSWRRLPTWPEISRLWSMRPLLVAIGVSLLAITSSLQASQAQSPDALARALQKRYQGIRDFSADFVQVYRGGVLKTQSREEGKVSVKKPGRMRWTYVKPEKKEFVSDGTKVYSYIPLDQRVIVSPVPPANEATTPALFLAGNGDIVRDFTSAAAEPAVPGTVAVKLTPRKSDPEFEYLVVSMDPNTLQIRALTTLDRQGGQSTLTFTNLKENTGISDKEFAFRIPKGVDVITNGQRN